MNPNETEASSTAVVGGDFGVTHAALFVVYGLLAVAGGIGNVYVLGMVINVFFSSSALKQQMQSRRGNSVRMIGVYRQVFIYVAALSVVDLLFVLHLPMLVVDMSLGFFPFGGLLCKLFWLAECANRTVSTFMLVVLSCDRYMAVCHPISSLRFRKVSVAIVVVICGFIFGLLLVHPMLLNAYVDQIYSRSRNATIPKCVVVGVNASSLMVWTFVGGYVVPAVLLLFFYGRMLSALFRSSRNVFQHNRQLHSAEHNRLRQVTWRVLAVVLFYFACWTPFWTAQMLGYGFPQQLAYIIDQYYWGLINYVCHILIGFNCAANPLLYAMLNKELRSQHHLAMEKHRHSLALATTNAVQKVTDTVGHRFTELKHLGTHVECSFHDTSLTLKNMEAGRPRAHTIDATAMAAASLARQGNHEDDDDVPLEAVLALNRMQRSRRSSFGASCYQQNTIVETEALIEIKPRD